METKPGFDSTKESLFELLMRIRDGHIQLPDFQRSWVWDDDHIVSLLASVSASYPIGAVMLLETGNPAVRLKPRLVEGVSIEHPPKPDKLILDGQQRLTALFMALMSQGVVPTKDARGKPIHRWYYLDIGKALDKESDPDENIISVPEDRTIRNFRGEVLKDYSSLENECAAEVMPLSAVFNVGDLTRWQLKYISVTPEMVPSRLERWNAIVGNVVQRFQQYQIPLIVLRKEVPKDAVCQVFEKVNTGGVQLNVFELLTATFAMDDYNLRDDWVVREKRLHKFEETSGIQSPDFLQAISLLTTRSRQLEAIGKGMKPDDLPGITCKRKDILRLDLKDYVTWADPVSTAFEEVARFLRAEKIFSQRDLPYRTQLVPLAAIISVLGRLIENDGVRRKLSRWYWCGVLGELYGGAIESRFAKDLPQVAAWVDGKAEPETVTEAAFAPERLLTLRTRNSAAYKGLHALLLRDGALDLKSGVPIDVQIYFDESIDIHHIFPKKWCERNGIEAAVYNSIVNKTPISAATNRTIGGSAPSAYLKKLQAKAGINDMRMDGILRSHLIEPSLLRNDDFEGFFADRKKALIERIETVMGKPTRPAPGEATIPDTEEFEIEESS